MELILLGIAFAEYKVQQKNVGASGGLLVDISSLLCCCLCLAL
jgi:hypothetical protein